MRLLRIRTYLSGKKAGVSASELAANLDGRSEDEKADIALRFARAISDTHGHIDDEDLKRVRDAGFSEAEIVEIIAHVGMNIFTNYFNNVAHTEVDFPLVDTTRKASAA
jgi:alkylhydroperoxidase family enzyme